MQGGIYRTPLAYVIMRLGSDFASARRAIGDSCRCYLDLPNIKEKDEMRDSIANVDSALERLQDSYIKLLNAMEDGHRQ